MYFYQRMLKISWTHLVSNKEVLRRAETKCTLLMIIRKRQLRFSGAQYEEEWVGRIDLDRECRCKEKWGRQREKYLKNLSRWVAKELPRRGKDKVKELNLVRNAKTEVCGNPCLPVSLTDMAPRERETVSNMTK